MSNDYKLQYTESAELRRRQTRCMSNNTIRPRPKPTTSKVYDIESLNVQTCDQSTYTTTAIHMDIKTSDQPVDPHIHLGKW